MQEKTVPASSHENGSPTDAAGGCVACPQARAGGARFCPMCGERLDEPLTPQPMSDSLVEESRPTPGQGASPTATAPKGAGAPQGGDGVADVSSKAAGEEATSPASCSCGTSLQEDAVFCYRCGARVGEAKTSYQLMIKERGGREKAIAISEKDITVGNVAECDLVISNDKYVSRKHARLSKSDGLFYLEDLGSSNGTFLRIRRPIILEAGDEIMIGTSLLRLEASER